MSRDPKNQATPSTMIDTLPEPRIIGAVNWIGLMTLVHKEVGRFMNVYLQTIVAPVITTVLFYMIFSVAFGEGGRGIAGVPYMTFLLPGLVMMSMAQNAFANTSSSIIIAKAQGSIVDVLMPPLSPTELLAGYVIGGLLRGLAIGVVSMAVLVPFAHLPIHNIGFILVFGGLGSAMMALLGILGGIWAEKFDHLAAITNFIVMPMTMLSGTFFSVEHLPDFLQKAAHLNPFFYMIDGFRTGFIGISDMPLAYGIALLSSLCALLWLSSWWMLRTGYKIRP